MYVCVLLSNLHVMNDVGSAKEHVSLLGAWDRSMLSRALLLAHPSAPCWLFVVNASEQINANDEGQHRCAL